MDQPHNQAWQGQAVSPAVSIVMGAYNGGPELARTIDSVLTQEGVDFEFIIVDDGSTDQSAKILSEYAQADDRIKIITQANQGLTRALIVGCEAANGQYIARLDNGDVYLRDRLKTQVSYLNDNPGCVLNSCGTRFIAPGGETLYEICQHEGELHHGLQILDVKRIIGPSHHGSTMFLRNAYIEAGGYRPEFYVAQDLDLWLRLAELGRCSAIPDIYYQAVITPTSISADARGSQIQMTKAIITLTESRRAGRPEDLSLVSNIRLSHIDRSTFLKRLIKSRGLYYIAANLAAQRNKAASHYFRQAWKTNPFNLKAAMRYVMGR